MLLFNYPHMLPTLIEYGTDEWGFIYLIVPHMRFHYQPFLQRRLTNHPNKWKKYISVIPTFGVFNMGDMVRNIITGKIFIFDDKTYDCDFNRKYERVVEEDVVSE